MGVAARVPSGTTSHQTDATRISRLGLREMLAAMGAMLEFPPAVDSPDREAWWLQVVEFTKIAQHHPDVGRSRATTAAPTAREHTVTTPPVAPAAGARRPTVSTRNHRADDPDHISVGSSIPESAEGNRGGNNLLRDRDFPAGIERFAEQCRITDPEGRVTSGSYAARSGDGCLAFVPELRNVVWPHKFRPEVAHKYDGTTNPDDFLQVYYTACQAAGGEIQR